MPPQPCLPDRPELRDLRHQYNRLCARFAGSPEIDPVTAARTVQELQEVSDRIVAIEQQGEATAREESRLRAAEPEAGPADPPGDAAAAIARPASDLAQLYPAIKKQEAQIGLVLRRCEEHQRQLEALERRLARDDPASQLEPQIAALGLGIEQQRQRVTALAIAVQRLLHWLASEGQPRR